MIKQTHTASYPNILDIKQMLTIIAGVFVLALASQLSVPMEPVPLSFQSTTVILLGFAFGSRLGAKIVLAYLFAGALGLPVFANFHAGIGVLLSPRGGYLAGFLPAIIISGYLAERGMASTFLRSLTAAFVSDACIFMLGICWLAGFIGWHNAFMLGLMPFVVSELVKLIAVAGIAPILKK